MALPGGNGAAGAAACAASARSEADCLKRSALSSRLCSSVCVTGAVEMPPSPLRPRRRGIGKSEANGSVEAGGGILERIMDRAPPPLLPLPLLLLLSLLLLRFRLFRSFFASFFAAFFAFFFARFSSFFSSFRRRFCAFRSAASSSMHARASLEHFPLPTNPVSILQFGIRSARRDRCKESRRCLLSHQKQPGTTVRPYIPLSFVILQNTKPLAHPASRTPQDTSKT